MTQSEDWEDERLTRLWDEPINFVIGRPAVDSGCEGDGLKLTSQPVLGWRSGTGSGLARICYL